ncbi:NAD(P)-dependent oxidoreductase [Piscinibacter sp. HJYY11]|uniref:NAD(P)-dependent oxidoreductase n=1 Tax=Piscinibacter sp. HJYY11 TaxID=2801333 RepID=UPI00191DBAF1|nr:NAD(P)-dependent oxidoreductase [Piscinibacter sp. HJYY11]MBL0727234.1 hydroxyacid dehydrogenase [Piscinibacter sp. HJYY11]
MSDARPRVLLTNAIHPEAHARLAASADVVVAADTAAATLRQAAIGCAVVVVRSQLPDDIFAAAPSLIGVVRHGAGVDMIPIDDASARGVLVANVPGVNANAVAEHVLRSMLSLARRSSEVSIALEQGGWAAARVAAEQGVELRGRTLGLVGFGHVGRAVARVAHHGLGMQVLAHSRTPWHEPDHVAPATLDDLMARSDVVVLACPLTPQTRGLVGAPQLAHMRRGSWLVNVARGPVVDEAALLDALARGHLAGAALDVFDVQPLPADHPFRHMPQVLVTPHAAGVSVDSMRAMGLGAVQAVEQLLRGECPATCVNRQALPAYLARLTVRSTPSA